MSGLSHYFTLASRAHVNIVLAVDLVTDPNVLSIPPHITTAKVKGFALAATKIVLTGGVGEMLSTARTNVRNIPRPAVVHREARDGESREGVRTTQKK